LGLGGGNVFKMWFLAGHDVGYAESLDGLSWTRRGSNVISSTGQTPCVIKNGSTYHLYCVPAGGGTVAHYTSSDGISWSLQSANVHTSVYYFSPVYIDPNTGTWYALFTTTGTPNTTNLATSPDGVTWTDYASNPVASNFWGIIKVDKIGSTFY